MSNKFKEINIKNCICHFFNGMINVKSLDQTKIKIDET